MRIGVNQFCFPDSYDVEQAMSAAKRLGFDTIELCLTMDRRGTGASKGGVTDALDISGYYNRLLNVSSTPADLKQLKCIAEDLDLAIDSIGGIVSFSIFPLNAPDTVIAEKAMDAVTRMIDAAQLLGAKTVLVIPGMLTPEMDYQLGYDLAQERMAKLAAYAPAIQLGVENVWNNMLYSPLELNRFVDETGCDNLGVYFDIANARRFGAPEQWIRTLGKRIKGLHCKDYRMSIDNINAFTNLLDGDVDYPKVIEALRQTGCDCPLVVELVPPAHYLVESALSHARSVLHDLLK